MRATVGPYRILGELRSGSLSVVYHARHEVLGRDVALKALKPSTSVSSSLAAELTREARILGELSHPNIAALYDFVTTGSELYLVLEYVDGHSLADVLHRRPRLEPEAASIIAASVARALEHVHERGFVHRDVKPGNILLSLRGQVKLIDFGIAQRMHGAGDATELVSRAFGTPAYMSPEQILGDTADGRSDLFSLGVVLYQMLAGVGPFDGNASGDARASTQRIRRAPAAPLRSRVQDVSRPLERIVMKLIEKLPQDRYASAATVADELVALTAVRVRGSPRGIVARALREAGFTKTVAPMGDVTEAVPPPLRPVYLGFAAILAVGAAAGATLEIRDVVREHGSAHAGEAPLQLLPREGGALRVLATPWADVFIDGQHIDTTPFALPVPLAPGRHFVAFTHPDAPSEHRTIDIVPGETTLLDVTMNVRTASPRDAAAPRDGGAHGS